MNPQQGQPFHNGQHGAGYTPQPSPYQGYPPQQQAYSQQPAYPYSNQYPYPQPMQQYPPVQNSSHPQQPYRPVQNNPYQQPYGNPYAQPARAAQPVQQLSYSQYYVQQSSYGEAPAVPSISIGGFSLPMPVLLVAIAVLILAISMLLQAMWLMWINVLIAGGITFFLWKTPYQAEVKGHLIIAAALAVLSLVIAIVTMVSGNRPDTASQCRGIIIASLHSQPRAAQTTRP